MEAGINDIMGLEPRLEELLKRLDLKGARVLELGCLEGMHSLMLQQSGAGEITAIEGRLENFLKCLIVKNAFGLNRCKFLFADAEEILSFLPGPFDLCLAIGVLYHLSDPVSAVYRISRISRNLFAWTHCVTEDFPDGRLVNVKYNGCVYRGKYVKENTLDCLSGLKRVSFWLFEDDLFRLMKDAGFNKIDLIAKEKHPHGLAVTFLAKK